MFFTYENLSKVNGRYFTEYEYTANIVRNSRTCKCAKFKDNPELNEFTYTGVVYVESDRNDSNINHLINEWNRLSGIENTYKIVKKVKEYSVKDLKEHLMDINPNKLYSCIQEKTFEYIQ